MSLWYSLSDKQQYFNFDAAGSDHSPFRGLAAEPYWCAGGGRTLSPAEASDLADRARGLIEIGRFRYWSRALSDCCRPCPIQERWSRLRNAHLEALRAHRALAPGEAGYLVFDATPSVLNDAAACSCDHYDEDNIATWNWKEIC